MDSRQRPRVKVIQEAWLRWLGASSDLEDSPPARCPVVVEEITAGRARLLVAHPYPVGGAVEILVDDELWLGEVVWRAGASGGYSIVIAVEQCLRRLTDMEKLCRSLLPEAHRSEAGGEFSAAGSAVPQPARQSASR